MATQISHPAFPESTMLFAPLNVPRLSPTYSPSITMAAFLLFICSLSFSSGANAQEPATVLPDAPSAVKSRTSAHGDSSSTNAETPGGSAPSSWSSLEPQSPAEKFGAASQSIFSYPTLLFVAAGAGISQAQNYYPEYHQGGAGYGRYLWHGYADEAVNGYMTGFVLPVLLHQDTRYYRLGHGSVSKRLAYSLSRLVVTRSDQGSMEFNTAEILGSGMAASISSTFYPERERNFSIVGQRWASNLGGDGLGLLLKEFSPELGPALGNVVHFRRHPKATADDSATRQSPYQP